MKQTNSPSVERLLTQPEGFGLDTATPLQRAICRILDGKPLGELAANDDVLAALGGADAVASLPSIAPAMVVLCSSVRSAKSMIAAADAIAATQRIDVSGLKPGEVPRVSVVATTKDVARVIFGLICGMVEASPALRRLIVTEPTADTIVLRHPSGRSVEICVVAGSRAGASLVARWCAGAIFDEAPRMVGSDDGAVVNLDDMLSAVRARLLPNARILLVGSPWAPIGTVFELVQERHGTPAADLVVIRGRGPAMNPKHFTPAFCEQLQVSDPHAYAADVEGRFIDGEYGFLPARIIEASQREPRMRYITPPCTPVATADLATRGNATTLVIAWREALGKDAPVKFTVGFAHEWKGTPDAPLKLSELFATWRTILHHYKIDAVTVDQWSFDGARELAQQQGIALLEMKSEDRAEMYAELEQLAKSDSLSLPPDPVLVRDLVSARKAPVNTGNGWRVTLPKTADGRHCDFAPSVALAARLTSFSRPHVVLSEAEQAVADWQAQRSMPSPVGCINPFYAGCEYLSTRPPETRHRWYHQDLGSLLVA